MKGEHKNNKSSHTTLRHSPECDENDNLAQPSPNQSKGSDLGHMFRDIILGLLCILFWGCTMILNVLVTVVNLNYDASSVFLVSQLSNLIFIQKMIFDFETQKITKDI